MRQPPENSRLTVKVDDIEDAYAAACRRGYEIVHSLTTEPWGIRRFIVRSPDGSVLNIAQYHDNDIVQNGDGTDSRVVILTTLPKRTLSA
jgi:hypothetical protein